MSDLLPSVDINDLQEELENLADSAGKDEAGSVFELLNRLIRAAGSEPERIEFSTEGTLSDDGKRIEISYDESDLCGMNGSRTTLLFDKISPNLITMVRTGEYNASLVFNAVGQRQRCMYDTGILPPFELSVLTRRIDNCLSYENGGTLSLDYIIEMRGVKTEYNSMFLEVREPKTQFTVSGGETPPT